MERKCSLYFHPSSNLLVFVVHLKTLTYDPVGCNVLADLENKMFYNIPQRRIVPNILDILGRNVFDIF